MSHLQSGGQPAPSKPRSKAQTGILELRADAIKYIYHRVPSTRASSTNKKHAVTMHSNNTQPQVTATAQPRQACAIPPDKPLQGAAMHCNTLRCAAVRCDAMRCAAMRCAALRCAALRCDALRCAALRCAVMRCDALQQLASLRAGHIQRCPHMEPVRRRRRPFTRAAAAAGDKAAVPTLHHLWEKPAQEEKTHVAQTRSPIQPLATEALWS